MQITDAERSFIRLVRELRFGRIESFRLVAGLPVIDRDTSIFTEYKLSGNQPEPEVTPGDEYLKRPQVRAMLDRFHVVRDGSVECLDVRDGLPFKMSVRSSALM